MDWWVELRDPNGDTHVINPAQVVEITLHGADKVPRGAHIVTTRGELTTVDVVAQWLPLLRARD